VLSTGFEKTYNFIRYLWEVIGSKKTTALFLLNKEAHDSKSVSLLKGLFSNQISFGKGGVHVDKLCEPQITAIENEKAFVREESTR